MDDPSVRFCHRVEYRDPDAGVVTLDENAEPDLAVEAAHAWSRLLGRRRGRGTVAVVDERTGQVVQAFGLDAV